MARVVVVGAGVIGTLHAYLALRAGHEVTHLERELAARGASVRNFGLIWVSGRRPGEELSFALRSRGEAVRTSLRMLRGSWFSRRLRH